MKTNRAPFLAAILALITSVAATCKTYPRANAESSARPPTLKDIAGAWVGYDESCLFFYRLDLWVDGKGSCVALYANKAVETYGVEDWRTDDGRLSLKLFPRSKGAEPISFQPLYVDLVRIDFLVKGLTNQWQRKVTVYHELEFMSQVKKSAKQATAIRRNMKAAN